MNDLFRVASLNASQWAVVAGASFSIIPIVEIVKFVQRKIGTPQEKEESLPVNN